MSSKLWFFPDPNGTIEEIDLGETISDLQFNPSPNQSISEGLTGALSTTQFNSRARLRVVHERFTSAALARDFYALETHLKNGGLVAIAVEASQAWAGFAEAIPDRGDTSLTIAAQSFPYQSSPTILNGDEVEVMGAQPYALREFCSVNGDTSGLTIALSESLRFSLSGIGSRWCFVRHRGFWPLLRLPKDQRDSPLVTHDHRISYTFDAQLEEAIDVLDALASVPENKSYTTTVEGGRNNPEQVNRTATNTGTFGADAGGGSTIPGSLPGLDDLT